MAEDKWCLTLMALIAMIAVGLYYLYEKGAALQSEKEAKIEQERQGAVSQFGTTCENATSKIAAYVHNHRKIWGQTPYFFALFSAQYRPIPN